MFERNTTFIIFSLSVFLLFTWTLAGAATLQTDLSGCKKEPTCTWEFGDGTNATGCKEITHTNSHPGNYTVKTKMNCGNVKQTSKRVLQVNPSYSWQTGDWGPTQGCGDTEQTRSAECVSDYDGRVDEDGDKCSEPKSDASRVVELNNACEPTCEYNKNSYEAMDTTYDDHIMWNGETICNSLDCTKGSFHYYAGSEEKTHYCNMDINYCKTRYNVCREYIQ